MPIDAKSDTLTCHFVSYATGAGFPRPTGYAEVQEKRIPHSSMDLFQPPFRWNLRFRESLGSLVEGERAASYPEFADDLLTCAAQCAAFSQNADMYFIGRSPESLFDLLSGLLLDTPWSARLQLVQFSMRYVTEDLTLRLG